MKQSYKEVGALMSISVATLKKLHLPLVSPASGFVV